MSTMPTMWMVRKMNVCAGFATPLLIRNSDTVTECIQLVALGAYNISGEINRVLGSLSKPIDRSWNC